MDTTDRIILKTLAKNARATVKQLAGEAYLSSPAASARVERLEKKGIITGYQATLNYEALGFHILAFVNLAIPAERLPEFANFLEQTPNVLECHHITGPYSLIMKTAFCSTKDLEAFVTHLQTYGKTETQVVFSTIIDPRQIAE